MNDEDERTATSFIKIDNGVKVSAQPSPSATTAWCWESPLTRASAPGAVLWHTGTATDLNTLVSQDSALCLESACSINDKGEIIGFAALKNNPSESHAYLAKPIANSGDRD